MAMPILFNFRAVQKDEGNRFFFALTHFGLDDSGVLFELEYDDSHKHPWGVLINKKQGQPFGYFTNLSDQKLQQFSDALSSYLNSGYGFTDAGEPIPVPLNEILNISERVLTVKSFEGEDTVELITVVEHQKELIDVLSKLAFFASGAPNHILNPPALVDNTIKKDS